MNAMVTLGSHTSLAVAVPKDGVAGQFTGVTTVGQVMLGAALSITWMVRLQVAVFPQSSVAVQLRVMLYEPGQPLGVVASENVMATLASHASLADAVPKDGVVVQFTGVVTDGQVILGAVLSRTWIERLQVAVLPQSSVAIHVRVTV